MEDIWIPVSLRTLDGMAYEGWMLVYSIEVSARERQKYKLVLIQTN